MNNHQKTPPTQQAGASSSVTGGPGSQPATGAPKGADKGKQKIKDIQDKKQQQPTQVPRGRRTVDNKYKGIAIPYSGSAKKFEVFEKEAGFMTRKVASGGTNKHGTSAAYRYAATAYAMAQLHAAGARNLLSVYGSPRDEAIAAYLNEDKGHDSGLVEDPFELTIHRPILVPQDILRQTECGVDKVDWSDYDGFLINDVYEWGDQALCPRQLKELVKHGPVFWIGHRFNGLLGTIHGEGAWIRVEDEGETKILSQPDKVTPPYPLHDPVDWMTSSGAVPGLTWATAKIWEETHVIRFSPLDTIGVVQASATTGHALREVPWPESSWWTKNMLHWFGANTITRTLLKWAPCKQVLVDVRLELQLKRWLMGRTRNLYTFKQLCQQASVLDGKMRLLTEIFPEQTRKIVLDTAHAAFFADADELADDLDTISLCQGTHVARYNLAVKSVGTDHKKVRPTKTFLKWVGIASVAYIGYRMYASGYIGDAARYLLKKRDVAQIARASISHISAVATCDLWWTNFALVVAEELVKHTYRPAGWVLIILEFLAKLSILQRESNFDLLHISVASSTVLMHIFTMYSSFSTGVFVHSVWNTFWTLPGYCKVLSDPENIYAPSRGDVQGPSFDGIFSRMQYTDSVVATVAKGDLWAAIRGFLLFERGLLAPGNLWTILRKLYAREPEWKNSFEFAASLAHYYDTLPPSENRWVSFRRHYYEQPWEMRGKWESDVQMTLFDPSVAMAPCQPTSHYKPAEMDDAMEVQVSFVPEVDPLIVNYVCWYLPTNIPMFAPGRTDANLLSTIEARILRAPPMEPDQQQKNWEEVVDHLIPEPVGEWDDLVDPWLENFEVGRKYARAKAAVASVRENPVTCDEPCCLRLKVFVKTDEVLCKYDMEEGVQMKPRPIINVDPRIQATVGPYVRAITDITKRQWAWKAADRVPIVLANGITVHITYGADATDLKLTHWMREVMSMIRNGLAFIIVAGDDSLVIYRDFEGNLYVFEGDASMFDQSQSKGPLNHQLNTMHRCSVPLREIQILGCTFQAKYVAHSRNEVGRIIVSHEHRPMRATGGPETSWGNSKTMGEAWIHALSKLCFQNIQESFRFLGFDLKLKIFTDPREATFLKGMWYEIDQELWWGMLPSRFLKVGKSLRDPRTLYKGDLRTCTKQFANDLAYSMHRFVLPPLMRQFVKRYMVAPPKRHFPTDLWVEHEDGDLGPSPKMKNYEFINQRYGLERDIWKEMEHLIATSELFSFLEHPGFERLALVDYS